MSSAGRTRSRRPTSPTSRPTTSRPSSSRPSSPSGFAARSARNGSPAARCPTSSASRTDRDGRSSATPGTPRIRSPRRGSATRSTTRSCAPRRSTPRSPASARTPRRWPTTSKHVTRDVLPLYEFTTQLATMEPPPPEMQQLLGAMYGNQDAMNMFVSITAGNRVTDRVLRPGEHRPTDERRPLRLRLASRPAVTRRAATLSR